MPQNTQHPLGRRVDQLVASLDIDTATPKDVTRLAGEICQLGRDAVARLARGILQKAPARRETVAALLGSITGEPASWALDELHNVLGSGRLSAMERIWLLATANSLQHVSRGAPPPSAATAQPPPEPQPYVPDEHELLLWRDEFTTLSPPEREAALATIIERADPVLLPLLEMLMSLEQPQLDAIIAEGLARFPTPAVLPLVRELLRRPDPAIRRAARQALVQLEKHGLSVRDIFVADVQPEGPVTAALATPLDGVGQIAILIARRKNDGRIHYAIVIVDSIGVGILRAWGEPDLTAADFDTRTSQYAEQSGLDFSPIDVQMAQSIVAHAESFAKRQGQHPPADYLAWRHTIGRPATLLNPPFVFGPTCAACATRVPAADVERGGIVAGDVVLCAACARQPCACVGCGVDIDHVFDEFYIRRGDDSGPVEFLCVTCARARQTQTPNPES
ncbi:HEAT repeat domain-containing protein [bacterium]|nr:HEAT repeat domain-containing protein [bacterium]